MASGARLIFGLVVIGLSFLAWGGQTLAWFAPGLGARLGLTEAEADVEPTYWADIRGEAAWDALTLWTMVVAGVLLVADHSAWAYFGLVGGGIYSYFGGRGVLTRIAMLRRGLRVADPDELNVIFTFLVLWTFMGLAAIGLAVEDLRAG